MHSPLLRRGAIGAGLILTVGTLLAAVAVPAFAGAPKVGICHHTGSETNPTVFIRVAPAAVRAHEAHGDEVDVADASACDATTTPTPTPTPEPTPTPTPTPTPVPTPTPEPTPTPVPTPTPEPTPTPTPEPTPTPTPEPTPTPTPEPTPTPLSLGLVSALDDGSPLTPSGSWVIGLAILGLLAGAWLKFVHARP